MIIIFFVYICVQIKDMCINYQDKYMYCNSDKKIYIEIKSTLQDNIAFDMLRVILVSGCQFNLPFGVEVVTFSRAFSLT